MPQVQDQSLDLLTCSPAHYHCTMAAPYNTPQSSPQRILTSFCLEFNTLQYPIWPLLLLNHNFVFLGAYLPVLFTRPWQSFFQIGFLCIKGRCKGRAEKCCKQFVQAIASGGGTMSLSLMVTELLLLGGRCRW